MFQYANAQKLGRKQYQEAVSRGEYPYLTALDDILANTEIVSEVNLGIIDVPLDKIVGTKTRGRTQAFASNFMPILAEGTEFSDKWTAVYKYQMDTGIYDPIVAYEFMNRFYVMEGNKRVSVLKYVGAYSISASVTRLMPKRTNSWENRLYYEFVDFYQVSANCDLWFDHEGGYARLLEVMGREPGVVWPEEEQSYFKAVYDLFVKVFHEMQAGKLPMPAADAFLKYLEFFGYDHVKEQTGSQMKRDLQKMWDELSLMAKGSEIELVEQPAEKAAGEKAPAKLFNWLMPSTTVELEMLKLGFIYPKTPETSSWTYSHELGRLYLMQRYDGRLRTAAYENAGTEEATEEAIERAIADGCNMIFTVAPPMAAASVKAALQHPEVRFFNCSVNMSYSSIRTYYARMFESKFLMGAIAAAMSESGKLGYIADYPIYGMVANINAFAMGASMINPRAKVYLKWSGLKENHAAEELAAEGISYISGDDMIVPVRPTREYGLYHKTADGKVENLASSIYHWGHFCDQIVQQVCRGFAEEKEMKGKKAINYWWGMSADVVDIIYSRNLPIGTKRLIEHLKRSIKSSSFRPFGGPIYTQSGAVIGEEDKVLSPQEILHMDWLCSNVIGEIPPQEAFKWDALALLHLQGIRGSGHLAGSAAEVHSPAGGNAEAGETKAHAPAGGEPV